MSYGTRHHPRRRLHGRLVLVVGLSLEDQLAVTEMPSTPRSAPGPHSLRPSTPVTASTNGSTPNACGNAWTTSPTGRPWNTSRGGSACEAARDPTSMPAGTQAAPDNRKKNRRSIPESRLPLTCRGAYVTQKLVWVTPPAPRGWRCRLAAWTSFGSRRREVRRRSAPPAGRRLGSAATAGCRPRG